MSALSFLVLHKAKNRVREIFRRPAELIVFLFAVGFAVFVVWSGNMARVSSTLRDESELRAILFGIYALIFVLVSKNGFVNGASMFSMADVNLLFNAPLRQKTMLFYGLFSQMGQSLSLGIVLIYQYSWLHSAYGVTLAGLLAIMLGYALTVFLGQMLAMLIYSLTSGSDEKCRIAKGVYYGILLVFLALLARTVMQTGGELLPRVVEGANGFAMHFFPVAGFLRLGVCGALSGNWAHVLLALGCVIICIALFYLLISLLHTDFYEDVLKAAEVSFSAITARKEGKAQELAPRKVKVGKMGFTRGEGASVIAEKHKIENRRSRVFLFDLMSLIFAGSTILFALIIKDAVAAFSFSVYMMMISVSAGRWAKELTQPYVYLIPEPPLKKLLYTLQEQLPALAAQSVLNFVVFPFVLECDWPSAIAMMAARFCFGLLFIGVNLLLSRLFGSAGNNRALLVIVYFLFGLLFSVPAVAAGVAVYELLLPFLFAAFGAICVVNLLIALLLLFFSRNILEIAQYNHT